VKVLILGSGVIGVTSAYFLARAGHEVTVVDRQPAAGLETSYGNAGEVSPGYSSPWAAPGLPFKAVKWLFMKNRPLVIWPQMDLAQWAWGLSLLMKGSLQESDHYVRQIGTDTNASHAASSDGLFLSSRSSPGPGRSRVFQA
jgi:glycine/D-amino acid oxidase-like deaminating enzyme